MKHIDIMAMLNELSKDNRFSIIFKNKKIYKDVVTKLNIIANSDKLYQYCGSYYREQNDVLRYAELVKLLALVPIPKQSFDRSIFKDESLEIEHPEEILIEDTEEFYEILDNITDNKFDFLDKIKKIIPAVEFSKDSVRSCVGITENNGERKVYINVQTSPNIHSRTGLIHELWHTLSDKYFNISVQQKNDDIVRVYFPNKLREGYMIASKIAKGENVSDIIKPEIDEFYTDQFISEIGTVFIEKIAREFLISKYKKHSKFCEGIKLVNEDMLFESVVRAQDAYFDQLICMGVAGTSPKIRELANNQIMENLGSIWKSFDFYSKLNQLSNAVEDKTPFVPLLEFRYVIGEVIAEEIYRKFKVGFYNEDKEKGKQIMSEIIEKMVAINNNINNIHNLKDKNSQIKNQVDIITEYLGIDKIEVLLDKYIKKLEDKYGVKKDYSFIDNL